MTTEQIISDHIIFYFLSLSGIIKKTLNTVVLEAFVKPFEQYSVALVKYKHRHMHIHTHTHTNTHKAPKETDFIQSQPVLFQCMPVLILSQ